jgi:hypothetical protein
MALPAAVVGAGLVLLSSCAPPSGPLPQEPQRVTSFGLPSGWAIQTLPAGQDVVDNPYQLGPALIEGEVVSSNDQDLARYIKELAGGHVALDGPAPFGLVRVNALTPEQAADLSIQDLRNQVVKVDKALAHPAISKIFEHTILDGTGMIGERLVFSTLVRSSVEGGAPRSVTIDQTVYLAPQAGRTFAFLVACTSACYNGSQPLIDGMVSSWQPTLT